MGLFGLEPYYNLANWYVYFYIYALCIMPLIVYVFKKHIICRIVLLIIVSGLLATCIPKIGWLQKAVHSCVFYTPVLAIGYICARTKVLSIISQKIDSKIAWLSIAILALAIRCIKGSILGFATDTFFAPVFVLSISALFMKMENNKSSKILTTLGTYSTLIWFIHAIPFSTATRQLFQLSSVWTNNVLLLYVLVVIISLLLSMILTTLLKKV